MESTLGLHALKPTISRPILGVEACRVHSGGNAMTMHTYLPRTNAFDPEALLTMSVAFELACADLQVFEGDERGREIIAKRIIDLARQGIMCPAALHHCVLADHPLGF